MKILKNKRHRKLSRLDTAGKILFPVRYTAEDGIFCMEDGRFSKTYRINDVNYLTADDEGKRGIFLKYSEFLNSMLDDFKISLLNRRLESVTDIENIYLKKRGDGLDDLREELNEHVKRLSVDSDSFITEIYVTVMTDRKKIRDARQYFSRMENDMNQILSRFGSGCTALDEKEKLSIIHAFYNSNSKEEFDYDRKGELMRGYSLTDLVLPDSFTSELNYFRLDEKYGRSMVFSDLPQYLKDTLITSLMSTGCEMSISVDVSPVPKDDAIRMAENKNVANEVNIVNYRRKQNSRKNWAADIPFDMRLQRDMLSEFLTDLTSRDQRMFLCTLTLTHLADTKDELDMRTQELISIASSYQTVLKTLNLPSRQRAGLLSSLPIAGDYIHYDRTLLTECLAVFMPFRIQDMIHDRGIVCGVNRISGNLIQIDRRALKNGNAWILGKPGAGKSFFAKQQILSICLSDENADVIIIDPEREYTKLVQGLGGEVINISSTSENHINPFDINRNYGDDEKNPVAAKVEVIISIFEQILSGRVSGKHRSVIDRALSNIYREYIENGYTGKVPTFRDLHDEFLRIGDTEISRQTAEELALESEIFTTGSLNTFAKETNVNSHSSLVCFDILDLGSQLLPVGMLVVLDSIFNRITKNRELGRTTYIFMDEIYLLFNHEYTAEFLYKLWKRIRKYGGYCTGITQNVEDLLLSDRARTMLSNSEFVVMLAQATSDRDELARLLCISDEESKFITDSSSGEGIIHIEQKNIPFVNRYMKDMRSYRLLTTRPGEEM